MATETETLLKLIESKAEAQILAGTFRGIDGLRAVVELDGGRVPAHMLSGFMPEMAEPVWVLILDDVAYLAGPTRPKPGDGTIVSASGGVATVQTAIGNVTATYDGAVTFAAGTLVKLLWQGGPHVVGRRGAQPVPDQAPVPGSGGVERKTQTVRFSPVDSGSYQPGYGWRTSDIWSSASNHGGWFYGDQIRDTIPDDAVINAATIYLPSPERLLGARPFGRHGFARKPSGPLSFEGLSTLEGTEGDVGIPLSLIDHLKVNSGGLGFDTGGWNVWPGRSPSGVLTVTFTA